MKKPRLTDDEIQEGLRNLPDWTCESGQIRRTFVFVSFPEAIAFTVQVAFAAERADHHPDIDIRWNKVTLALTTHDSGGLTENDLALATQCDALVDLRKEA
jgi:4a-hydroxytetrahydrobiopterin dehydratase